MADGKLLHKACNDYNIAEFDGITTNTELLDRNCAFRRNFTKTFFPINRKILLIFKFR